jgi:hypothetical protein
MVIDPTQGISFSLADWIPQAEIWTAIIAGLSITVFLLIFSHPPFTLPMTMPRYLAATGTGLVVWFVLLWLKEVFPLTGPEGILELVAGALIFLTAVFGNFYLSNISAGFRIEMLINLTELDREVTLDEWMTQYGKGKGMGYFLENRLQSTLLPWRMAVWKDGQIILTRFGRDIGRINCFLASLFSVEERYQ